MEISLEGKVALITGAGPNIGSGIALALARYGAKGPPVGDRLFNGSGELADALELEPDGDSFAIRAPADRLSAPGTTWRKNFCATGMVT